MADYSRSRAAPYLAHEQRARFELDAPGHPKWAFTRTNTTTYSTHNHKHIDGAKTGVRLSNGKKSMGVNTHGEGWSGERGQDR